MNFSPCCVGALAFASCALSVCIGSWPTIYNDNCLAAPSITTTATAKRHNGIRIMFVWWCLSVHKQSYLGSVMTDPPKHDLQ